MRQSSCEDDTTKLEILIFLLSKLSESKIDIKCVIKRSGSSFKTTISELFVGYSPDKPLTVPGIPTSPPRAWGEWMGYVKDMYPGAEFECIGIDAFSIAFFRFPNVYCSQKTASLYIVSSYAHVFCGPHSVFQFSRVSCSFLDEYWCSASKRTGWQHLLQTIIRQYHKSKKIDGKQ